MTKKLRTIIVGFGQIADGLRHDAKMAKYFTYATHAQVLSEHPAFDWLGAVDPSEQAQRAARENWNIPYVAGDLASVAREVKPEIAIIAAPPGERAEIVQQLPTLKAVLVEKPLGVGGEEGQAFIKFCREKNVQVQVNFWRRGDDLFRQLAGGGLNDAIGKPQAAFATYGNGLFNNGGHMVDFIRMLLGEVATVQALDQPRLAIGAPLADDQSVSFALGMANRAMVTVQPLDFSHYREIGLDIWGDKGRLALFQESLSISRFPLVDNRGLENEKEIASDAPETLQPSVGKALYNLYDNLADTIAGTDTLWSPGEQALETEIILDAVLGSASGGGERLFFR